MRKVLGYIFAFAVVLVALSCERRPLIELSDSKYRVEFEFDTLIKNDRIAKLPEVMNVFFFHNNTKEFESSHFVEQEGGEVYVVPSAYDIITYNFNTESTIIQNNKDYYAIEATTNEISKFILAQLQYALETRASIRTNTFQTKGEATDRVMNQPDHLFTTVMENIKLEPSANGIQTIRMETKSIVERWHVEVETIEGVEFLSEASMLVSGAVSRVSLSTGEKADEKAALFTDLRVSKETGKLYGEFNTFGMHPLSDDDPQLLTLILVDRQGKQYHYHYKMTTGILNLEAQKIKVVDNIKIEPPQEGGGGFDPSVNEWNEVITGIVI